MILVDVEIVNTLIEVDAEIVSVEVGAGGGSATVENSNASYTDTVNAGDTLVLPDENFDVYVNGVLNTSFTYIPLSGDDINITA
jgi:hypothetical protein